MEFKQEFTVPAPVDQVWPAMLDAERVARCLPGATLESSDGDEHTGQIKVKLGAITVAYRGSGRILAADEDTRTVTAEATGKETRGAGTASATVRGQLRDEGGATRVTVHTRLNVTGRPAQFGRSLLAEVGGRLADRFAEALAQNLAGSGPGGGGPLPGPVRGRGTPAQTAGESDEDAIDLLKVAGPPLLKRTIPVVVIAAVLAVVLTACRRLRRRASVRSRRGGVRCIGRPE